MLVFVIMRVLKIHVKNLLDCDYVEYLCELNMIRHRRIINMSLNQM